MQYIDNSLLKGEKVVYATRPHWFDFYQCVIIFLCAFLFYFIGYLLGFNTPILFGLGINEITGIIIFFIGIFSFIKALIFHYTTEYGITNKRVIMKIGWFEPYSVELFLDKIEIIHVNQSVFGLLFNFGSFAVVSTGRVEDIFNMVPDPLNFRKKVQHQIDSYIKTIRT